MPGVAEALKSDRIECEQRIAGLEGEIDGIVEATRDVATDDEHDPEGATIAFERARVGALLGLARQQLREIDAALQRVASGDYGVCVGCGRPIESARLSARPTATTCIGCAS